MFNCKYTEADNTPAAVEANVESIADLGAYIPDDFQYVLDGIATSFFGNPSNSKLKIQLNDGAEAVTIDIYRY